MARLGLNPIALDILPPVNADHSYILALEANIEGTFTVPAGQRVVIFASVLSLWVGADLAEPITIPAASDTESGDSPMYDPPGFVGIGSTTTLHLISDTAGVVNLQFYS